MDKSRLYATYQLDTFLDINKVVRTIAGEQSSGTFVSLPGESDELMRRSLARVEETVDMDSVSSPALIGAQGEGVLRRYLVKISWPVENFGFSLPNILATIAGNLFELKEVAGLKIKDIFFPDTIKNKYKGPAFGIEGTRRVTEVFGRPLIGTIVKPSVGLNAKDTAGIVKRLCEGGIDFIKDDELQADGLICPFTDRVKEVMRVLNDHREKTGKKVMYAFNLTGAIDEMEYRHEVLMKEGASCAMVSLNSVGVSGLIHLREYCELPIHAHRNGWGYLGRSENNGWDYKAWQKIWRLIGVDHMHVNGIDNKFWEPNESVIRSALACTEPMFEDKPCSVMPVFSSGQTVLQVHQTNSFMPGGDLIYCAGGGIMAHPDGISAGVESLRMAWDAAQNNIPLEVASQTSKKLANAVKKFKN